jgi:hypothetical protein
MIVPFWLDVYPTELMNQLTDRGFASVATVLSFTAEAGGVSDRLR